MSEDIKAYEAYLNELEAFLEAAALLADERGYHGLSEEALEEQGAQALLDCMAVYAALGADGQKRFAAVIAQRFGAVQPGLFQAAGKAA